MSCSSIVALSRACGSEGIVAGLEKLYIVSYSDLDGSSGSTFTTATNGQVNDITLAVGKKYVEVGLLRSSTGLNEALTKNVENGTAYFTQTMTLVLSDMTVENQAFIKSVLNQPVSVLLKARTGKYFVAGLSGQFELSGLEGGTGIKEGDLAGYTLTFTGIDTKLVPSVDPTIIAGLIA